MIALIVNFWVQPGTEEQTKDYVRVMQENTRKEPGCRLYVGQQAHEDPRHFCFYEQYDDQPALDAHRAAPYFNEYVTRGLNTVIERRQAELFTVID
jgi:autoinducer 2-degrading protein